MISRNGGVTMKRAVWLLMAVAVVSMVAGCNGKGDQSAPAGTASQKVVPPDAAKDRELALKYLQAVQNGDRKAMYEAENLTDEMVNESREKLIHPAKYNLTAAQSKDLEHILRMSGEIDFFMKKVVSMFPKTASFQVIQTTVHRATADTRHSTHSVKISYGNRDEAMSDKTGKSVKEMTVQLQHIVRLVNGRWIHEISFSSNDFEKLADRDFAVLSYF
jgi:predicted small lipoprotein YifL